MADEQNSARGDQAVTVDDLKRAAELTRDLLDDDVMRGAWSCREDVSERPSADS